MTTGKNVMLLEGRITYEGREREDVMKMLFESCMSNLARIRMSLSRKSGVARQRAGMRNVFINHLLRKNYHETQR